MVVKILTSKNFDDFIKTGSVIIDFHAEWCGPCKIVSPIVEELASEIKDVKFGKVDVDKEMKLSQRFNIHSIPTLLFFKDNKQEDRVTGALSKEELQEKVEEAF